MSRRFGRGSVVVSCIACAVTIGPVAAAQASDATLRATVKSDAPKITRSQAKILKGVATYQQTHSSAALITAIKAQDTNLKALEAKLSGESASSAAGTKGKAEIIKGLGLIVGSNHILIKSIVKKAAGKPVSKAQLKAAVMADAKGNADLNAGAKLLKV